MKNALFTCVAALIASSAHAEVLGTEQEANAIKNALEQRYYDQNVSDMWYRTQQKSLTKSLVTMPLPTENSLNASARKEKCFPWAWEGGQRQKIAVATAAQVCLRADLQENTPIKDMSSSVEALGDAELFTFNQQFQILRARAEARMPMQGTPTAEAELSVLNKQVWSDSVSAPEVRWSKSFKLLNFEQKITKTFLIGPVPASVTVGARGNAEAAFSARVAIGNAEASATPKITIDGYAFGGIDIKLVKGGIEGALSILSERVNIQGRVGLILDPTTNPPQLMYAAEALGTQEMSSLKGGIDIVAETAFPIPGFGKQFRYPIFRNPGFSASGQLFKEVILPTPIVFQ